MNADPGLCNYLERQFNSLFSFSNRYTHPCNDQSILLPSFSFHRRLRSTSTLNSSNFVFLTQLKSQLGVSCLAQKEIYVPMQYLTFGKLVDLCSNYCQKFCTLSTENQKVRMHAWKMEKIRQCAPWIPFRHMTNRIFRGARQYTFLVTFSQSRPARCSQGRKTKDPRWV